MSRKINVEPGQKFERLEIIAELPAVKGKRRVFCRCDCGTERVFDLYKVVGGVTKSCGCYGLEMLRPMEIEDLTSRVFERLTVVQQLDARDSTGSVMWACVCDCGSPAEVSSRDLIHGNKRSCGCLITQHAAGLKDHNEQHHTVDGAFVPVLTKKISSNNSTGTKGVSVRRLPNGTIRYMANITIKGKRMYLGIFDRIEDAIAARKVAEERYHQPYIDQYEQNKKSSED